MTAKAINTLTLIVAAVTLLTMFPLKYPIKRITRMIADKCRDEGKGEKLRKFLNLSIVALTIFVAAACYYCLVINMHGDHFKWCISLKAAGIAMGIYGLFEQLLGR